MRQLRRWVARIFDDSLPPNLAAEIVNAALAVLIVVNVVAIILESVEEFRQAYDAWFWRIERFATAVFAVEYVLRLWTVVDRADRRYPEPFRGRLRYAVSFFAIVDLIAVLPAVFGLLGSRDFRLLRVLRLLRMLKLTRHSTAFGLIWAVFREEVRSIAAVLFILLLTLVLSASLMYIVEGDAQPNVFTSIPAAMWWAIETITTVGYGDMVPISTPGRILGGLVSVVGIGAVALLSGLITVSFLDQLRLRRDQFGRALQGHLGPGPITEAEFRKVERIGESQFGLPESEAAETVEAALQADKAPEICPRCGYPLAQHRAAAG